MSITENEADSYYYQYVWPLLTLTFGLRPLHYLDIRRRAKIQKGERVLEVGAGIPLFRVYSGQVGRTGLFVSLDIHHKIQQQSKNIAGILPKSHLEFVTADAFKLPFMDGSFDVVIANNFHMGNPASEAYRVLKPGGRYLESFDDYTFSPMLADGIREDCQRLGFINTKASWGAPGLILPIFWNRVVEATKPL